MEPGSSHWYLGTGQEAITQTKTQEIPLKHTKKNLHYEGGHLQEQDVQSCCRVSILGDIENLIGHDSQQPALAVPALSRGLDQKNLQQVSTFFFSFSKYLLLHSGLESLENSQGVLSS